MINSLIEKLLLTGGVPLLTLVAGWLAGRYVKPWVHDSNDRLAKAQEIAIVADRITDELVLAMPTARWDDILDKLVDRLIEALELNRDVAMREGIHALTKRGRIPVSA
jgi:hypothetical protein